MTFETWRPKGTKPLVHQLQAEFERIVSVQDVSNRTRPAHWAWAK